jgi:hypothetical protein
MKTPTYRMKNTMETEHCASSTANVAIAVRTVVRNKCITLKSDQYKLQCETVQLRVYLFNVM